MSFRLQHGVWEFNNNNNNNICTNNINTDGSMSSNSNDTLIVLPCGKYQQIEIDRVAVIRLSTAVDLFDVVDVSIFNGSHFSGRSLISLADFPAEPLGQGPALFHNISLLCQTTTEVSDVDLPPSLSDFINYSFLVTRLFSLVDSHARNEVLDKLEALPLINLGKVFSQQQKQQQQQPNQQQQQQQQRQNPFPQSSTIASKIVFEMLRYRKDAVTSPVLPQRLRESRFLSDAGRPMGWHDNLNVSLESINTDIAFHTNLRLPARYVPASPGSSTWLLQTEDGRAEGCVSFPRTEKEEVLLLCFDQIEISRSRSLILSGSNKFISLVAEFLDSNCPGGCWQNATISSPNASVSFASLAELGGPDVFELALFLAAREVWHGSRASLSQYLLWGDSSPWFNARGRLDGTLVYNGTLDLAAAIVRPVVGIRDALLVCIFNKAPRCFAETHQPKLDLSESLSFKVVYVAFYWPKFDFSGAAPPEFRLSLAFVFLVSQIQIYWTR